MRNFGLWIGDFGLRIFQLRIADCGLGIFQLWIADFGLRIGDWVFHKNETFSFGIFKLCKRFSMSLNVLKVITTTLPQCGIRIADCGLLEQRRNAKMQRREDAKAVS
jgi:hypothetical protein